MWGEPPPTTRKAAAYQVGKSECRAGKGLGPRVHLSIKNTGSEIILLIDVLSSSARVSWKSGSASYDAEGGHHQKIDLSRAPAGGRAEGGGWYPPGPYSFILLLRKPEP